MQKEVEEAVLTQTMARLLAGRKREKTRTTRVEEESRRAEKVQVWSMVMLTMPSSCPTHPFNFSTHIPLCSRNGTDL